MQISLPFWKNGAAFEPKLLVKDMGAYGEAEEAAFKANKRPLLLAAREALVVSVLSREQGGLAGTELTAAQVNQAFDEIWAKGPEWKASPLENSGGSSVP